MTEMIKYKLIHFKTYEFVDRQTYNTKGDYAIADIDWRILWTADAVREYFNKPMTINNWFNGGNREWSGIRFIGSPYYSQHSQHSFGRAIDFLINGIDASIIRKEIINHPNEPSFQYITTLEDFPSMNWIHIDSRVLKENQERFYIVKPN